jgi:hypothetical protein
MKLALSILSLAALAGCAHFADFNSGVRGLSESAVVARFGAPAERRPAPGGGTILEYPREPLGFENWRVTVGPDGRVSAVEQTVDEPYFARLATGMTRTEVLHTLGRESEQSGYKNLDETVMSWRYREFGGRLMFFNVHFDGSGRMKATSRTLDPAMMGAES